MRSKNMYRPPYPHPHMSQDVTFGHPSAYSLIRPHLGRDMASFLDDTKNFGLLIAVVGLVDLIVCTALLVEDTINLTVENIGGIVAGVLYLLAGVMVFTQRPGPLAPVFPEGISSKFGVLAGYIFLVRVTGIINVVFVAAFGSADQHLASGIGAIVLAAIILAVGWIVTNNTRNIFDKVIHYMLIVIFAAFVLISLIALLGVTNGSYEGIYLILAYVDVVAAVVMYLMAFLYLLSADVKAKFF